MGQFGGAVPMSIKRVSGGFRFCEACNLRTADVQISFNPPGRARVKHDLCDTCAGDHPKR